MEGGVCLIYYRKNIGLRIRRIIAGFLATTFLLLTGYIYIEYRLKAVVRAFAMSEAKTMLINSTNRAASEVLKELDITYDMLVDINRKENGEVNSVQINTVEANKIKTEITNRISTELAKHQKVKFYVPVFAAFGYYYTAFYNPRFSYEVGVTTTVGSNFSGAFETAGINQVLHQILLDIKLESDLAMPKMDTSLNTVTSFLIAETVITGVVPDAFTSVVGAQDETIEDIFDHGATIN